MAEETATQLEAFATLDTLCLGAAERIVHAARTAVDERKRFRILLSGGSGLDPLYRLLVADYREAISWSKTVVFFADAGYAASGNAVGEMLARVPVGKRSVHRPALGLDAEGAARGYEEILRRESPATGEPAFDLALLGVADDGGIASLAAGSAALAESERWVVPVRSVGSAAVGVTLTLPILNRAREVLLIAPSETGTRIAHEVLGGACSAEAVPAGRVRGAEQTVWMVTNFSS